MKRRQQGILTGMPFMAHVSQRSFVDDLGRRIFLAKAPTRIVSLAPSLTEILFAIGAGSQVAGVTEFCDYPAEAQAKPKVGYSRPNLESIVSLQPDLIVAPQDFLQTDVIAKLEQLKIPVFVLQARTVEDIAAQITTLGRMLERPAVANDLAGQIRRRVGELRDRAKAWPKRRVLYVLNSEPLTTVGPDSYIHQLLAVAGGENVASRASVPYPRLSIEEVLRQDPDVLLFPVGKFEAISEDEQQTWHRWATMAAVKHNRLVGVPSDLINRPGPRIIEGLDALARAIHPEAFAASETP
jgi:iron complex transport system substrate-binding protein